MGHRSKFFCLAVIVLVFGLSACQAGQKPALVNNQPTPTIAMPFSSFSGVNASPADEGENNSSSTDPDSVSIVVSEVQAVATTAVPTKTSPLAEDTVIQVDVDREFGPISPYIYGVSGGELDYLESLRPSMLSWGGNPSTRYNWQLGNAWNAGSDWFYMNGTYGINNGVSAADEFLRLAKTLGIQARLAVPTLGWVAKDRTSCSFPNPDGTCGNADGASCEKPGQIADPLTANTTSTPENIGKWMEHLADQPLMPEYIAMDNEPELWGYTHYDVHPECTTYEEVLEKYLATAQAVRNVLPEAQLAGPVACCWYSYWNTAPGPAEQGKEAPADYIAWFLDSLRQHDQAAGQRLLDVLDVHFYPQGGVFNDETDGDTKLRRLRSTRALWDQAYSDESWIDQPIYFIPRMQELIDQYYPGTRLGISEWNFGADQDISGALAIADTLGIYGREGVYYAAYWRFPPPDSPGYYAFKLYTNYDDQGSQFGGASVWTGTNSGDAISSYAAYDRQKGSLQIMLIHKNLDQPVPVSIQLTGFAAQPTAVLYRYTDDQATEIEKSDLSIGSTEISLTLPPASISLVVLSSR